MEHFLLSLDRTALLITSVIGVFATVLGASYFFVSPPLKVAVLIACALLIVTAAICLALSPRGYAVGEGKMVVKRIAPNFVVKGSEILSFRRLNENELGTQVRKIGVGGLHGYFGKFHSSNLGSVLYMASRLENLVLVERKDKYPLILSPDDPERFLNSLRAL